MKDDAAQSRPSPDPTSLTTEQLEREITHLRELIEARLDEMDKALIAARDAAQTATTELDANITRRIAGLSELTDSKFITHRTLLDSQADKVALALAAADKAVSKAEATTDKRLESMNEVRGQLHDQATTFIPRTEYAAMMDALTEKIDDLKTYRDTSVGRFSAVPNTDARITRLTDDVASLQSSRSTLAGQATGDNVMQTLAAIQKQINDNSSAIITSGARTEGVRLTAGALAGGLAALATIVGLVVVLANVLTGSG